MSTKLQKFMTFERIRKTIQSSRWPEHIVEVYEYIDGAKEKYRSRWFTQWLETTARMCDGVRAADMHDAFSDSNGCTLGIDKIPTFAFATYRGKRKFIRTLKTVCGEDIGLFVN